MPPNRKTDDPGGTGEVYSPKQLTLLVAKSIKNSTLLKNLLDEIGDIGEGPIQFVKNTFESELLSFVKASIKKCMTELVVNGNTKFIKYARSGIALKSDYFSTFIKKLTNNDIKLDDERLANWETDFGRFYNLLENRYVSIGPEETLKNLIVEWFEAGEMSLDVWKTWASWFSACTQNNGQINLSSLRSIKWPPSSPKDTTKPKFLTALEAITLNDFLEKDGLQKFLKLQLEEPTIEVETNTYTDENGKKSTMETSTLNVFGRSIFLSLIKERLENHMKSLKQVDIVARNAFYIDCDLDGRVWQGKNIAIVADKVNVCGNHTFNVSGSGFVNSVELKHAKDGAVGSGGKAGKNGENGRDGKAGESSGGISIVTPAMSNPEKLTLKLVGGDGENGESGGAGGDGQDGVGITEKEFKDTCITYGSLYLKFWEYFRDWSPSGWTNTVHKYNDSSLYIYDEFEDKHGRKMFYKYGADKGWYNWYELSLWIKGTDGTAGGIGGLNGKGGEGGNRGECFVINPDNGFEYPVEKIQRNGQNGQDGKVGACGKSGINGNDMSMIDRSASGRNKFYYGLDGKHRLLVEYYRKNDTYRRINRYRYIVDKNNACYEEFVYGLIPQGGLRAEQQQKKEERSSEAQMTMKQSIVLNKVMQKAQDYKNKADSAIGAVNSSTKSSTAQAFAADEEVEEEESTEQEQEVVIVKEVNEDQLDSLNARARKCKMSAKQYVDNLISQPYKSPCIFTQQVIDFFSIEFDYDTFVRSRLLSLKKCFQFKAATGDAFKKVVIAAIQAKHAGLNLHELEALANLAVEKRATKKAITHFRSKVSDFPIQCHTAQLDIDSTVDKINDKIHKVKFVDPEEGTLWHFNISDDTIQKVLASFFKHYELNAVDFPVLEVIDKVFKDFEAKYSTALTAFERPNVIWGNPESWKGFKASLIEADPNIEKLMTAIGSDKKWLTETFQPLRKLIDNSSFYDKIINKEVNELKERFGAVPDFHNEVAKNFQAAQYLIRFYWQMKTLLSFNRRLLVITLLYKGEVDGSSFSNLKSYSSLSIDDLIMRATLKKVDLGSDQSEKYMLAKKFQSMAFRFLVAELYDLHIELFGNEKYGTIHLMEATGSPTGKLVQLYHDGDRFYNIVSDDDLRKLLMAREATKWQDEFIDNYRRINQLSFDYSTAADKTRFASFFPSIFSTAVHEWIDCYLKATGDDLLLKMLHERFEVDGNHLEIADFQFIISTAILLRHEFEVNAEFILNYAASTPQATLVDAFVLIRIENQWRTQLQKASEISTLLNSITNNRFKILLVTKLGARKVDEDQLLKMLIMIRHTSSRNTELEKMTLDQFISAAEKQELMELSSEIKNLGTIGYYIIYLRQQKKMLEAEQLEIMFTQKDVVYHIPEKLIAQVCTLIISGEIDFNGTCLRDLKNVLEAVTVKSGLIKTKEHLLITDETQQGLMIAKVAGSDAYQKVISEKQRSLNVIAELIKGIRETAQQTTDRRQTSMTMVSVINDGSAKTVKLLNKIDDCIAKLRGGIRLRDTQKMAVIYAVQSDTNLLAQVNTGEGKSYIVTATAIIRAKQYRFVDIITSSPVLAQRDADEMKDIYYAMNVSIDHNCHEEMEARKQAYKANVVYGEIGRFQRDYLLHHFYRKNILGERDRSKGCVIVDEVDNMLLDNGNNMLYLSHSVPGMDLLEPLFVHIERVICTPTIRGDPDKAFATETIETGILADLLGRFPKDDIPKLAISKTAKGNTFTVWSALIEARVIDIEGYLMIDKDSDFESRKVELVKLLKQATTENHAMKILVCLKAIVNRPREIDIPRYLIPFCRRHLTEYIENAKRALFMKPNEAYVVDTDRTGTDSDLAPKVTIIDQNTGVDLATSQWSEGLHQCIQIKHGCRVNPISMKAVFVSNVNYLKGYSKINGLSGTLGSYEESNTLVELYKADLIKIPTFKAKRLYEQVPVITNTEAKWLDALFDEIADQVKAKRSVLVICHSISKVMTIEDGLLRRYKDNSLSHVDKADLDCYKEENMVVYKREHDEFQFGDDSKLASGRLILATNLAGRGTDIKLSDSLKKAGGLHVIVSFLPENSRIEDQAYGRAARCGDPGSGQIIALSDQTDASGEPPTVFDLKLFRDNAEVQRLQSLTAYYNYHTKIEEDCLTAFKDHCLEALTLMNNSKKSSDGVPTEAEIVYFALLDEWALWLDSQAAAIKQCAKVMSDSQRSDIIASVKSFLDAHPIEPIDKALKWINCPQPMLALGVRKLDQNSPNSATNIFKQVIAKFPQFTGDASYYLGVIAQRNVRKVKKIPKANTKGRNWFTKCVLEGVNEVVSDLHDLSDAALKPMRDVLPDSICEIDDDKRIETEDHLLQALQGFNRRVERKKEQSTIISRLQQTVGPQIIKSDGFQAQADDMTNVYDALSTSAYDMMGHPVSFATFAGADTSIDKKFEAQETFLKCLREGYITEKAVNHNILDDQCEVIKKKYLLSKKKLQKVFKNMVDADDGDRIEFYKRTYLQEHIIRQQCRLPKREEFWGFLASFSCFSEHQEFYVLNTDGQHESITELRSLKCIKAPTPSPLRIQLSDYDLSAKKLYDAEKVEKAFEKNKAKLKWLIDMKYLIKDASGIVNRKEFDKTAFMPNFDYFTDDDIADWLEIPSENAEWIVDRLLMTGTLREEETWLTKINPNKLELSKELEDKYNVLLNSKDLRKLDDVNFDVIKELFGATDSKAALMMKELTDAEILIPKRTRFIFQAMDDFDVDAIPKCLQSSVEMFLYHKFSYTFAYNALRQSLDAAMTNPDVKKPIMLAWKPHEDLMDDLIKYGFIHKHRLEIREKEYLDDEMQQQLEEIEKKSKSRLFIKSGTLLSTKKFFKDESVAAGVDVQVQAINHIRQVGKIGENNSWIFWLVLKIAFAIFMAWSIPGLIMMALDIAINFKSYFQAALLVIAAVGTMLYFFQSVKAKYMSQTGRDNPKERYTQLLDFHNTNIIMNENHLKENKLVQAITSSITAKLNEMFQPPKHFFNNHEKDITTLVANSKLGPRRFARFAHLFLDQPHNWRLFHEAVRDILTRIKPTLCTAYYEVLDNNVGSDGIKLDSAMNDCQKLRNQKFKISEVEERLLSSLLQKIIEDAGVILQEAIKNGVEGVDIKPGEDPVPEKIPDEFIEPGSEIDINANSIHDPASGSSSEAESKEESIKRAVDAFAALLYSRAGDIYELEITNNVTKPIQSACTSYIKTVNDKSEKPPGFKAFFESEVDGKYDIESRKKQVVAHQSMAFIVNDLQEVVRQKYADSLNDDLLETIIRYGHAMEPSTMERLVHVLLRVFKTYLPQLDNVNVVLHVDKDVLTFSTSKTQQTAKQTLTVSIEISQEHFYVCQEDSRIIFKNKNDTDYIGSCLFETITLNKPELSELAKQGAEVFRELLLQHIPTPAETEQKPALVPYPVVEDTVDVKPAEDATKTGYFNFDYKNNRVTNFFKKKK